MTRFVKNHAFEREIQDEAEFIAEMGVTTTHVAVTVQQVAPDKTGYYKRRVKPLSRINVALLDVAQKDAPPPRGNGYAVIGTDPFSHLVEAGSVNNLPYAPLQRGARAAGLKLVEDPHP